MTADPAPPTERRAYSRTSTDVPARLTIVGLTVDGALRNIGAGGVCFTTRDADVRIQPGNFVLVSFECLRDGEPQTVERSVRVLRVEDVDKDAGALRAFGLQFEELLAMEGLDFSG